MKDWLEFFLPVILLVSSGVAAPLFYLRRSHRRDHAGSFAADSNNALLWVLLFVAVLSMTYFIFTLLFE